MFTHTHPFSDRAFDKTTVYALSHSVFLSVLILKLIFVQMSATVESSIILPWHQNLRDAITWRIHAENSYKKTTNEAFAYILRVFKEEILAKEFGSIGMAKQFCDEYCKNYHHGFKISEGYWREFELDDAWRTRGPPETEGTAS